MRKRIFYLSDYELQVFLVKGKTLTEVQRFQSSDNKEFANYLSHSPKTPIIWIVDSTQEDYQVRTLPHVYGKDHRYLMAQKMARLFKDMPYTYGVVQGREKQGRRDDRVLFMALNNPNLLAPWLNTSMAYKVPIIGIYSLPLLCQALLKYFPKAPYLLLVTHTRQGLRQSFFVHQKLQLSRLTPLKAVIPQEYAKDVLTQISTTQRYLNNARMLPEPLSVVILSDTAFNTDSTVFNLHLLNSHDFAQQLGLQGEKTWYLHHFVALLHRWHITQHYATDSPFFYYRKVRMAFYILSVLLLSGATMLSLKTLEKALIIQQQGENIAEKTLKRQAALEQLKQKKPNLPLDIMLIRSIVDLSHHLKARHLSPRPAWEKLSHVLSRYPDLFLERLEWRVDTSENDEIDPSKHFIEGMRLHGIIKNNEPLQIFDSLMNDLRQDWRVEVERSPYSPSRRLQGQIGEQVNNAPFVIDLLIKHSTTTQLIK
ncbi:hypothetical protein PN36_25390 [Candidatus Thiomargarita nelsonii]|uniref:Uncharacterized protein n=1 Tax=Candidatus Thiomargarita nelsonii TaxID=1003181 RepID=A0A0A6P7T2_9GAMM|nr:hypothetical protein PN36_25390 [Candidatus Thiomargarita nelsonii]